MVASATAAVATVVIGESSFGWAAARALLIRALTAFLASRSIPAATSAAVSNKEQPVSQRRIARVTAAIGAPVTLAGVAMYFLPGPGLPVLIIGLALLLTGLVMAVSARHQHS
ncbi:PGPGW domain-containing protein [Streptomyces adustus]